MEFLGSILTGVVALVAVILALVGVLMFAERRLVQSGKVKILINGDASKSPEVDAGGTLLSVLCSQGGFLPSACGGGGTCAIAPRAA